MTERLMCRRRLIRVITLAAAILLGAPYAPAQDTPAPDGDAPTIQAVQDRIASLKPAEDAGTIDDEGMTRLQLYRQALESLRAAANSVKERTKFANELTQAPVKLESVRAELAEPPAELTLSAPADATLAQLEQSLAQSQADLDGARTTLRELDGEPQRRASRVDEIRQQITDAQQSRDEIRAELAKLPLASESPELTDARRTALQAGALALDERLGFIQAERDNYAARVELLPLRRELWNRRVTGLDGLVAAWGTIVDGQRAIDIERQQQEARRAEDAAIHPAVARVAAENRALADQRDALRAKRELLVDPVINPDDLQNDLNGLKERVNVVGMTSGVGMVLRNARQDLPDPSFHRREINRRQQEMSRVLFDRFDFEDQYDELVHGLEGAVTNIVAGLAPPPGDTQREIIEQELREQLRTKRDYLRSLKGDLAGYFDRLQELNEIGGRVADLSEEIADYIDERILWIRSAEPIRTTDIAAAGRAIAWLTSPSEWRQVGATLWAGARSRWPLIILTAGGLIALLVWRRRLREKIRSFGDEVSRPACDTFRPTLLAALFTILRSGTWPLAMWAVGAWLTAVDTADQNVLTDALGGALRALAVFFFVLELVWEACQSHGLAESHFRWPPTALRVARRQMFWLIVLLIPTGLIAGTMARQPNIAWENSLGRFALIAAMAVLAVFAMLMLRPSGGLLTDYLRRNRGGWLDRLSLIWYSLAVLVPPILIVVSAIGYHNTAIELLRQILQSVALVILVSFANGLLMRWLFLAQRRLSREQLRQRRLAYEEKLAAGEAGGGDAPQPPEEEFVDISAVGSQTRQLVRGMTMFALLIGFWAIWAEAFPAIAFLDTFELPWRAAGDAIAGVAADGTAVMVYPMTTLKDLLVALIVVVMTLIVGRNIPGLLEIAVLQRLPLDRGSQFAISTIVRYTITIIGCVVALGLVGLTWSKVQWLAAAVTVGLGFGLQEIFGNFVSGLIILFERPIRVGDTVTVGEVHGTVSRIRIRATTIVDWDRKEMVIPNKEFVTGSIVNWTLSDPILRVVVPVGIAYGSDTALAEKLLLQTARDNPIVLDEPRPTAVFSEFGDSALEFSLRMFIPNIDNLFKVRHEIHTAIDRAFRQAGIEIAFPQRDIHVRSITGDTRAISDQPSAFSSEADG